MDKLKLDQANKLNQKIREFSEALNCFEWKHSEDSEPISLNPRLIIEFDGDGREQIVLPMNLNNEMIAFLKSAIKQGLEEATNEFDAL